METVCSWKPLSDVSGSPPPKLPDAPWPSRAPGLHPLDRCASIKPQVKPRPREKTEISSIRSLLQDPTRSERNLRREQEAVAAVEGAVIACHAKDEFDAQMAKAKQAGKVVIIDFMSPWCGGCEMIAPFYAQWAKQYPAAVFLQVDVFELKEVADLYKIKGMPTFVFIKNGETLESITSSDEDRILDAIKKYVGTPSASASAA